MSGTQGLIGFEGCCCNPEPEDPCGADVDDFEFDSQFAGAPWYINPVTFYARFSVQDVYINMGYYEPYDKPTSCTASIEDDSNCCGGPSLLEICCPASNTCDGQCEMCCCQCPPCDPNSVYLPCGGTQGTYGSTSLPSNLNVDGEGTAVYCCNCPGTGVLFFTCTSQYYPGSDCNDGPVSHEVCPNQAEDVAFLFSDNFAYCCGFGSGDLQYKIPCDNSTISTINADIYGHIDYSAYAGFTLLRDGYLEFSLANIDFKDENEDTICNTLMLRFIGEARFCTLTAGMQYGTATWAKKYSPLSNLKTAGTFVTGRYYKIKTIGTTNFTLIGAASNTVGVKFQATGIGAGTGTAYLARTEAEAAIGKYGTYSLRAIDTMNVSEAEADNGDHTWVGIERNTAVDPIMGECVCVEPTNGECYGSSIQGSCGGGIQVDYPTCYNMYTDVMPGITHIVNPPQYIVVTFT